MKSLININSIKDCENRKVTFIKNCQIVYSNRLGYVKRFFKSEIGDCKKIEMTGKVFQISPLPHTFL